MIYCNNYLMHFHNAVYCNKLPMISTEYEWQVNDYEFAARDLNNNTTMYVMKIVVNLN
jgi:hypothetical protein